MNIQMIIYAEDEGEPSVLPMGQGRSGHSLRSHILFRLDRVRTGKTPKIDIPRRLRSFTTDFIKYMTDGQSRADQSVALKRKKFKKQTGCTRKTESLKVV